MPLLGPVDTLPRRPRRVLVSGTSGSGKTTLAAIVADRLGLDHVELDSLHHGPNWVPRPEFEDDVRRFAAGESWVTEWQYAAVRPLLLARADTMVWLDLPRPVVLGRVVRRTISRRMHHQVLWNGNIEPPLHTFFTDRDHIVRWAWRHHASNAQRVRDILSSDVGEVLLLVRLASQADVDAWCAGPLMRC